jgi:hypothetical protein
MQYLPSFARVRGALAALACAGLVLVPMAGSQAQPLQSTWQGIERVVAFADVHGAYNELTQLLREAGVVNADLGWAAGKTHVVSLGDLLDRGDDSRKVMDLLMRLQREAAAAGGQLHVVLGNHEAMNVLGDLRYVTPGEYAAYTDIEPVEIRNKARAAWLQTNGAESSVEFDRRFPPGYFGHRAALGPTGKYGKWLLGLPAAIVINDSLFMHGGPSALLNGLTVDALNLRYRTALTDYLGALAELRNAGLVFEGDAYDQRADLAAQRLAASAAPTAAGAGATADTNPAQAPLVAAVQKFRSADDQALLSPDGPNWYRGAAMCNEAAEADTLHPLLRQFAVARVVVGHTPTRNRSAVSRFDGAVIKLDAGMNAAAYKGRAAALVFEQGKLSVRYPGDTAAVAIEPEGLHVAPATVSDTVVAAALQDGQVTVTGPGGPDRLLVSVTHAGRTIPAVFVPGSATATRKELAAYRLDRLLQLGIVPATVEREVQGQRGTLQAQPRKSVTQADVQRQSLRPGGWCPLEPQFQLVYAFDALTANEGRTLETLLLDAEEWFVYATGYDNAFAPRRDFPAYLKAKPPAPGAELRKRLQKLDAAGLSAALGGLVDERALKAVLARRDALLALPLPASAAVR